MLFLFIVFAVLSLAVSWRFRSKVNRYSQVSLRHDMSGAEIAEAMLKDNGIYDVKVISTEGSLTDHYNPLNKTVNLSHDVYHGRHITAASIAAHECGHAVQHATAYSMLKFRSAMVPMQNASARILNIIIMVMMFGGMFLFKAFPFEIVLLTIIACQGVITLFSVITLPVEFDASNRALAWLTNKGIVMSDERDMAKDALKWAAMTYVVAALSAIASLLYWVMMLLGRRD
ncbi:MAG: zinc metallopeptidase [Bacteroidota bacterium]|jgi:Zn-dependent membrane protease YugP|nr:zinc metallopeptidase [Sphingobacteriales bacterium]